MIEVSWILCLDIGVDLKIVHVEDEDDAKAASKGLLNLIDKHERRSLPNTESPLQVHLGTEGEHKIVFVSCKLDRDLKNQLIILLNEFKDVFVWSYEITLGLNTDIVVNRLPLQPECKPVKQKLRRTKLERNIKIKEEVVKQLEAGVLEVTIYLEWLAIYPEWLAKIVLVPKKDGNIMMCVD